MTRRDWLRKHYTLGAVTTPGELIPPDVPWRHDDERLVDDKEQKD
jgi:hypothetical protein